MVTVTRAEFMADAGAVMRRSETEGPIGIEGEDGKVGAIVHCPRDERLSDQEMADLVRAVWPIPCEDSGYIPTCRYCRTQMGTPDGEAFEHKPTCAWLRLKNAIGKCVDS